MFIAYLIFGLLCIASVRGIVVAIKEKSIMDLFIAISFFPIFFSGFVSNLSGGSALHSASSDYELYQVGHYYLVSHGDWVEVSCKRFYFILISEIIGFTSLAVGIILSLIQHSRSKA